MGFAIAEELAALGASVTLITGPTSLTLQHSGIKRIDIISAEDMLEATLTTFEGSDVAILSAAVADYRPTEISSSKIKKEDSALKIDLIKTQDILATLGKLKSKGQLLVGFALETDNEEENAIKKLKTKNLDFIVLNSLKDQGAGFRNDSNKITIIDRELIKEIFELKPKSEVAADICKKILNLMR